MNEQQLKLELAKAFPEIITIRWHPQMAVPSFWWTNSYKGVNPQTITDREWLQVCWACEKALNEEDYREYCEMLMDYCGGVYKAINATFPQRATPLVKLKGGL